MAEDAVWEVIQHSPSGTVRDLAEGRDAVLDWFKRMMGGEVTMSEGTVRHFINTHVITVEEQTARSTSHLQAVDTTTLTILANGFVDAEHTKGPTAGGSAGTRSTSTSPTPTWTPSRRCLELEFE